jgi:hypothetical protein
MNAIEAAFTNLAQHTAGTKTMTAAELVSAAAVVETHKSVVKFNATVIDQALRLVESYERSAHGPLFSREKYASIPRSAAAGDSLARTFDRTMLVVQQAIIDHVYNHPGMVQECNAEALFLNRSWLTADFYPGAAAPPNTTSVVYAVALNATVPRSWGLHRAYDESTGTKARRPTGLYLSPGQVVNVTVPKEMVDAGYEILVGGQTVDNSNKDQHLRLDRVTVAQAISATTSLMSNPLGGGIYILVPYLANLSTVTVYITGGVVRSPLFQRTGVARTTLEDWRANIRTAPGPWADFETDNFMLLVPSSWIYNFDDPASLLAKYDLAMEGTAEMFGYPPAYRHGGVHTLYLSVDRHIRATSYGIGYPQVNTNYDPRTAYDGNVDHWFLRDPLGWSTCWHEAGHAQQRQDLTFQYWGETEAIVNFLEVYVAHVKYNVSFAKALAETANGGYEPDQAAVHWLITPNFRDGNQMNTESNELNEMRYQTRGYSKYADIVRLFGWETFTGMYHKESLYYEESGCTWMPSSCGYSHNTPEENAHYLNYTHGLSTDASTTLTTPTQSSTRHAVNDIRTLRWSIVAGVDITPLIHAWGVHPANAEALRHATLAQGLKPSEKIRCLLLRYRELIPANNTAFNIFFEAIHPGRIIVASEDARYGKGWYNAWRDAYNATHGAKAKEALSTILTAYYGVDFNRSCVGVNSSGAVQVEFS